LAEWRAVWGKDFRWFLWSVCLTLVVSQWIGIQTDPGNYIILILPLILVMTEMENHEGRRAWIKSTFLMLSLLIGLWLLFFATVEYRDQPQQHSIMFFPLPLILMIGIYWVRRWVIHPSPELFSDPKAY
jgi:vacuolar-type H+-ATPase subunit I/STV1